jgi:MFS family permease
VGVTAGAEGVWAPSRRALTVGIVSSISLTALELLVVATALPAVARNLGRSGYGVAIGSFAVASVLGVLLGGPAVDRFGPVRPYLAAASSFAAGLVLAGTATTMTQFIAGRAVQGLGAGAMAPILYAAIGRGYPESSQLRMFSLASTAWVLPGVAGPGLAGVVTEQFGWRWVFFGLVPFVAVAATVTAAGLRSVPGRRAVAADVGPQPVPGRSSPGLDVGAVGRPGAVEPAGPGAVLARSSFVAAFGFALGAALVLAASGLGSWLPAVVLLVAGLGLGTYSCRIGRFLPAGLLRAAPGTPAVVLSRFLLLYAFVAVDAFVPLAVTAVRDRSVLAGSVAVTAGTLTWTGGTWTAERLVTRQGPAAVLRLGFAVLSVGILVQLGYLAGTVPLAVGFVGTAIAGFGTGLAYGLQSALVLAAAPEGGEGQASSAVALADTLAFAAGPAVTGALVAGADRVGRGLAPALAIGWVTAMVVGLAGALVGARAAPTIGVDQ